MAPAFLSSTATAAAPSGSVWRASSAKPAPGADLTVHPSRYQGYTLDAAAMTAQLDRAPAEDSGARGVRVEVPAPNGELVPFDVVQTQLMEPGLAGAHPDITTYAGKAATSDASVVIDVSPYGFHAAVRGSVGSWYVDPAVRNKTGLYLSYRGSDVPAAEQPLVEPGLDADAASRIAKRGEGLAEAPGQVVTRRTYRLALLTDPTYAEYVAPGTNDGTQDATSNAQVLAAKTTLMNRVNQIYTNDLAVRLVLVDGTDKLNLNTVAKARGANGPCGATACYTDAQLDPGAVSTNGCTGGLLTRNRVVIGQLIGAANFDIGHIGLGINGGGIAGLGVVGGDGKARGCTGLPDPVGDFYAIDYVAHEMGHQFSGNHTFNGNQVNCSTSNRSAGASVEPGSGSSVMAYAGICVGDDLQPHTDPYFSQRSQTEITNYLTSTLAPLNEVQGVAFNGGAPEVAFDGADQFTLTYDGIGTTLPIVRGQAGTTCTTTCPYTAAGIKAAIETLFNSVPVYNPTVATVAGYFGGTFGDNGFQVTYTGAGAAGKDIANPTLDATGFTGYVNDVAKGGAGTNAGAQDQPVQNHAPVVTAPASTFIPTRTPFTLSGTGSDSDSDSLIYLWEQNDVGAAGNAGGTGLQTEPKTNGPLFRVFGSYADVSDEASLQYNSPGENLATTSPSRTFPDMAQILAGNTNAATGTCPALVPTDFENDTPTRDLTSSGLGIVPNRLKLGPALECRSELLPTAAYIGTAAAINTEPSLNFRLTARDQDPAAGGYQFADTKLRIDRTAGPFLVTSQSTPTSYAAGSSQAITWDVNGTDKPSLAPQVRISMSTDGGQTFPVVLAASTANDGSETVQIPNVATTQGRIKIEAVGNYFFDVNDAAVTVTGVDTTAPDTSFTSGPENGGYLLATSTTLTLASSKPGATFTCTLDGAPVACTGSALALSGLAPGTHRVTAAAVDGLGNTDASPATTSFTVPLDDAALRVVKGRWTRSANGEAYAGTLSVAKKRGATLGTTISGATRVAVVVSTGKRLGNLKVKLNGKTLEFVRERGRADKQVVLLVADFATPTSGTLTLKTANKKKVVVDGLLVVTAP